MSCRVGNVSVHRVKRVVFSRFGGLGPASNTVPYGEPSNQTSIESLNRRLQVNDMKYSGDLNTNHLNTEIFEVWISNGLVFKWSVYGLSPMY